MKCQNALSSLLWECREKASKKAETEGGWAGEGLPELPF